MSVDNLGIVGIGASAGGLAALQDLVRAIPEKSGLAYIVVQHLAPDHPSIMDQLLSACCKLPVTMVGDNTEIAPDHVYVIPPGPFLVIQDGRLKLVEHQRETGLRTPIDRFFKSMANECGPDCCAVILSGTGSDGTEGLRAVKAAGGVAIVQKRDSARFPGMPDSAAATGLVDLMLQPADIPPQVIDLFQHRREMDKSGSRQALTDQVGAALPDILDVLRGLEGHDFAGYKPPTLVRRVLRRMALLRLPDVQAYVDVLRTDDGEATQLAQDFLIGVTEFFRDRECFDAFCESVLPDLLERSTRQLRVWVPGCSSGEEVFSLAMLICDALDARKIDRHVQIFGTDIDLAALRRARSGLYQDSVLQGIDPAMRDRFFARQSGGWRVRSRLREMCVFAPHNLLQDPPFSRLDMISCRNVMIYLSPEAQNDLLPRFHYALNPGGYLMLGASESLGNSERFFKTVDRGCRLFQRNDAARPGFSVLGRDHSGGGVTRKRAIVLPPAPMAEGADPGIETVADQAFLQEFAAPYAVINAHNEVLYQSQAMARFVRPGKGAPSAAIDAYLVHGLRLPLQNAVSEARANGENGVGEVRNVIVSLDDSKTIYDVRARVLDDEATLVVLQEVRPLDDSAGALAAQADSDQKRLETELLLTRKRLADIQREYENAEQDLRSSNEELLSMNEELQSSNEELETSREELQSVNEELETINSELTANNRRLTELNSDLKNLLESTELATVFLDKALCVRLFTPSATRIFNLQQRDIGRPIVDLRTRVEYPQLAGDAAAVAQSLDPIEREVHIAETGEVFLARVRPYRSVDDRLDGCILTFQDITESRKVQQQLAESAEMLAERLAELETLYDTTPVGLALMDTDLRYLRINETLAQINGLSAEAHVGQLQEQLLPAVHDKVAAVQRRVLETGEPALAIEVEAETPATQGERKIYLVDYFPVRSDGRIFALGVSVRDITEQRLLRRRLSESEARMKRLFDQAPASIAILEGPDLRYVYTNPVHNELAQRDDQIGKSVWEIYRGTQHHDMVELLDHVYQSGTAAKLDEVTLELVDTDGEPYEFYARFIATPWFREDGETGGVMVMLLDLSETVLSRKQANKAHNRLRTLQDSLASFVGLLDLDGRLREVNQTALDAANLRREDVIGKYFWECYWWNFDAQVQRRLQQAIDETRMGRTVRYDTEICVAEDSKITIDFQLVPVTDDTGKVIEMVPSGIDISKRKEAEDELRRALAEFEAFFRNSPLGMAITDLEGRWLKINEALARINGQPVEAHIGQRFVDMFPHIKLPADKRGQVARTGQPVLDYEVTTEIPAQPGEKRTFSINYFPIRVGDEMRGVGHSVLDISEQKAFEAQQRLLIAELQHRVKNTLATVQSITRFTARTSATKDDMAESLQQRLSSIARTHDALTREDWQGQSLMSLLQAELAPYDPDGERVTVEGQDVRLDPGNALSFGLGFHELATNAAKYGALAQAGGRIEVRVAASPKGTLSRLEWFEHCPTPIKMPDHEGFGSFLLKSALGVQVDADVDVAYTETGLHLTITAQKA